MALPSANFRVAVLRKTKLGERDLILTMLASDGSLMKAVAKGARKPTSPFSSRLELYCVADVLVAQGRSLGIIQEARLVAAHAGLHSDIGKAACAAPVAELLWRVAQEGLEVPRLFRFASAAFDSLDSCPYPASPRVCAAALVKTLAFCGMHPTLDGCAICGGALQQLHEDGGQALFSFSEGGAICARCKGRAETVRVPAQSLALMHTLLRSTFEEVVALPDDQSGAFSVLQILGQWIRVHVGSSLKSLGFLFSCGLF
ncbi:MAG: DNA repair protein RecO [Eggerthellaceae bacterium]|nr:DNA repair protein RecO [Eggerthellaceae bacterium]